VVNVQVLQHETVVVEPLGDRLADTWTPDQLVGLEAAVVDRVLPAAELVDDLGDVLYSRPFRTFGFPTY
jgi:hypothetical protein